MSGDSVMLLPVVGILAIAAITPGPNNILVFHAAMNGGVKAAAQSIAGVICGSFALLGFIGIGFGILTNNNRDIIAIAGIVGSIYLAHLGVTLFRNTSAGDPGGPDDADLPSTFIKVTLFQLVNPKGWILMSVVWTTALPIFHWSMLFIVLTVVFTTCLSAWACAGTLLSAQIRRPTTISRINCSMGITLIVFALILLVDSARHLSE